MVESQKLVLLVQSTRIQGLIWQAVLRSQNLAVIWEFPDINLVENLNQLKAAGLALPNLLLIDVQIPNFNPYDFCRWCRQHHPEIKIILTHSSQPAISTSQRQWALHQGAAELFPGLQLDHLVSSVAAALARVLEVLAGPMLNGGTLIAVLMAVKRQMAAPLANSPTAAPYSQC
jgi:CheY-like chemotaxis protein